MLIALGFSMIAVFMYLILAKRLAPTLALVLVPLTFATTWTTPRTPTSSATSTRTARPCGRS